MTDKGFRVISPAEVRAGGMAVSVVAGLSPQMTYEELAMGAHLDKSRRAVRRLKPPT